MSSLIYLLLAWPVDCLFAGFIGIKANHSLSCGLGSAWKLDIFPAAYGAWEIGSGLAELNYN